MTSQRFEQPCPACGTPAFFRISEVGDDVTCSFCNRRFRLGDPSPCPPDEHFNKELEIAEESTHAEPRRDSQAYVAAAPRQMQRRWYYMSESREYGPISAIELRSLADSAQLHPLQAVRCLWWWVKASQLPGLFADLLDQFATLQIVWEGHAVLWDSTVRVTLNEEVLGDGSFRHGFLFGALTVAPGRHTVRVARGQRAEKVYYFDIPDFGAYSVKLLYQNFWGTFDSNFVFESAAGLHAGTMKQWQEDFQTVCCPHCGAWSLAFVGEEHVSTEYKPETVWQTEVVEYENPRYGMIDPFDKMTDMRQRVLGQSQRPIQVQVAYETWQHVYQCNHCGQNSTQRRVKRQVP